MSMSSAAIPTFEIALTALSKLLDKAEAFAAAKKIDPSVLLNARLAPDMFPLAKQVQIACDMAKFGAARLSGIDPPKHEDNETTVAQLKERIAKTIAFVKSVDTKAIDASGGRTITIGLGGDRKGEMKGADYLNHFVFSNLYFHVAAAYAILRHNGVDIGKRDFLGAIPLKAL